MPRLTNAEFLILQQRLDRRHPPPQPVVDQPESKLQGDIETWLKSLGHECYYVRARMDQATTFRIGTGDFVGFHKGVPFYLEAKRKGRKATPEQLGNLLWAEYAGARTGVVYSLAEAQAVVLGKQEKL